MNIFGVGHDTAVYLSAVEARYWGAGKKLLEFVLGMRCGGFFKTLLREGQGVFFPKKIWEGGLKIFESKILCFFLL